MFYIEHSRFTDSHVFFHFFPCGLLQSTEIRVPSSMELSLQSWNPRDPNFLIQIAIPQIEYPEIQTDSLGYLSSVSTFVSTCGWVCLQSLINKSLKYLFFTCAEGHPFRFVPGESSFRLGQKSNNGKLCLLRIEPRTKCDQCVYRGSRLPFYILISDRYLSSIPCAGFPPKTRRG